MKKWFVTFGDDNYRNSKIRIANEAKVFGFDEICIYGPDVLSEYFINQTKPYIDATKGAGYWLWKAFILKKVFTMMLDGDILVYTDAGCYINPHGKETFDSWTEMLNNSDSGMIRLRYENTPEEMFTNEAVFEYFGKEKDMEFRRSDILMNGVIIYKKNANSQKYIDEFYDIAITRPDLFSDEYNDRYCECFKVGRHDQSISSCLVKTYNFISVEDHTFGDSQEMWMELIYKLRQPFLATRLRN